MTSKRSYQDSFSSISSNCSNINTFNKLDKRLKFEQEIFSKSIKDIENMFNFNHIIEKEENDKLNGDDSTLSSISIKTPAKKTINDNIHTHNDTHYKFSYDCINLSFINDEIQNSSIKNMKNIKNINTHPHKNDTLPDKLLPSSNKNNNINNINTGKIKVPILKSSKNQSSSSIPRSININLNFCEIDDDDKLPPSYFKCNLDDELRLIDKLILGNKS